MSDEFDLTALASAPFAGPITFARRLQTRDLTDVDVAVVGIPFDLGTSYRSGARFGPRAIREQSLYVGEYPWGHWPWELNLFEEYQVIDWGDLPMTVFWAGYPEKMVEDVRREVGAILGCGVRVLGLGGDHMVSYPLLAATAATYGSLSLVHLDAHSDTWDMGDAVNHGTMFRHAALEGFVDPARSIQVGMRTPNPDTCGFRIVDADVLLDRPLEDTIAEVRERVGDNPVYLTFDIDFLDPSCAPGTGTPVVGGPSARQARKLLRGFAGLDVVGADIVEVAPGLDPTGVTAVTGATIALDLLHLLVPAAG
ncbi:MAG: Agmatinase [Acidimicrobiales bacterium]|nr:Agmatinase [Acidimicrobiales bacterium]